MLEGIPAYIYSGLWIYKTYRKLLITIDNGDFKVEALEDVKSLEDLEQIECDSYMMAQLEAFTGGAEGIMTGINDKSVIVKGSEIINILAKLVGGL